MSKKVMLRADASHQSGWGHVSRMQAMGEMLNSKFDVSLFSKTKIENSTIKTEHIEDDNSFFQAIDKESIVVLDGYDFDLSYQDKVRKKGAKLVCIDDHQHTEYIADIVINHAPGVEENQIKSQSYTQYLLGPKYALLRSPFLDSAKRKSRDLKSILICFGGSDVHDLSFTYSSYILSQPNTIEVKLVVGNDYQGHSENISDGRLSLFRGLSAIEMRDCMRSCDLAIVPASTILMECLSQKMRTISGYYIENQQFIYRGFLQKGMISGVGSLNDFNREKLDIAIKGSKNIEVERLAEAFDSQSSNRIIEKFKSI